MLRMKKISKGGSIVFISSVASIRPYKGNSLYSATKGAINSFSKVLATELGAKKIRVNCIHPGIVCRDEGVREGALTVEQQREEMAKFPLGMGETDDIAYAVVYLLSNVSKWITGIDLIVDGGQSLI
jgi:NAD(P)-dependent dehydrogenase (short-subunit alcohol dehydrogenase family)